MRVYTDNVRNLANEAVKQILKQPKSLMDIYDHMTITGPRIAPSSYTGSVVVMYFGVLSNIIRITVA